ncbi:LON peptidase substrate-binding domain-containing protein [Marivirga arenosa]|uniref:LON peptidase substrate-binding domain-containing protein n=1 Tax=Marivirga arenosa TaxID=3059076 RepID=A0AA49GBP9_9BACT|nr:LON peptidase substrate-binding domain-containing protein [Marivirga sp. BKB1-2]WKK80018.2 LON peptidase substrate-binding domain-containing protein [Marivirga sp. BKB1-2]
MSRTLPLFPLNLVAFPFQNLNLHIFEPRYKELIADCIENNSTFAIPSYVKNKVEYGTEMEIREVSKKYDDGRFDIKTRGIRIIKVLKMDNPFKDKKYAVGSIEEISNKNNPDIIMKEEIFEAVQEMYDIVEVDERKLSMDFQIYDIAHQIGLSKDAEYELIQINEERQRQRFVLDHLKVLLPKLRDLQRSKELIKMNGHFRKYNPPQEF